MCCWLRSSVWNHTTHHDVRYKTKAGLSERTAMTVWLQSRRPTCLSKRRSTTSFDPAPAPSRAYFLRKRRPLGRRHMEIISDDGFLGISIRWKIKSHTVRVCIPVQRRLHLLSIFAPRSAHHSLCHEGGEIAGSREHFCCKRSR